MNTFTNNFQARVQLQNFYQLPVEIIRGDSMKPEPLQLPCELASSIQQPISATKQAFLDMASAPLLNLDDLDDSFNFNDSDPEILLSDSDEEDEELIVMADDDDQLDADTAIDSADLNEISDNCSLDEEGIDHMDDFEESTDRNSVMSSSLSTHNSSPANKSASADCKRIFIDLPAVEQSASFSSQQ